MLLGGAAALFFLSGVSALIYQVSWQRILGLHTGLGVFSMAVIVAAFLTGLGIGSHLGGAASLRLDRLRSLRAFAVVELGIGLAALASPAVYYDLLYVRLGHLYEGAVLGSALHFLSLLPPTALMGASLPLLARAVVRDSAAAGSTMGVLYGVNVVGAAVGALLAPWFLIPELGLRGAIQVGAAANFVAGLGGLALVRSLRADAAREGETGRGEEPVGVDERERPGGRPLGLWALLYATSGGCALSLEMVWFRLTDVAVKSTAFTFGSVLAVFLAGLAVGSLLGVPLVRRVRRPLATFLTLQCGLLLYSAAAAIALVSLPADWAPYAWFVEYWRGYEGFALGRASDPAMLVRLYVAVPLLLFFPATVLMGLSFPVLQRAVHDDPDSAGFKVGLLQAANIAGCVVGSLSVALLAFGTLGTTGTLRLLLAVGIAFAALGVREYGWRSRFPALAAALAALAWAVPGQEAFWLRLHGVEAGTAMVAEDGSAVVSVRPMGDSHWGVTVNGQGHSWLPYGDVHSWLGAIPALVHPAPRRIAVIGLGSGDTAWSAGCRPETEHIRVYEIAAPQVPLLKRLAAREDPPFLRGLLADPRLELQVADGRNALAHGDELYDLIEADAVRPHSAISGNLYSLEFFTRTAERLRPGGVMCTWAPTPRIRDTFRTAFPHVLAFAGGEILVGSRQPLEPAVDTWLERLHSEPVQRYLGPAIAREIQRQLRAGRVPPGPPPRGRDLNRDLFPRDEFVVPAERGGTPALW